MIRKEIKEIVENINKFEITGYYKYGYKKIRIDPLWEGIYIDEKKIKLSFWEKRYLFKPFRKITEENEKCQKNYDKEIENKLLQSINFEE